MSPSPMESMPQPAERESVSFPDVERNLIFDKAAQILEGLRTKVENGSVSLDLASPDVIKAILGQAANAILMGEGKKDKVTAAGSLLDAFHAYQREKTRENLPVVKGRQETSGRLTGEALSRFQQMHRRWRTLMAEKQNLQMSENAGYFAKSEGESVSVNVGSRDEAISITSESEFADPTAENLTKLETEISKLVREVEALSRQRRDRIG